MSTNKFNNALIVHTGLHLNKKRPVIVDKAIERENGVFLVTLAIQSMVPKISSALILNFCLAEIFEKNGYFNWKLASKKGDGQGRQKS